jgi:hypothetical protein
MARSADVTTATTRAPTEPPEPAHATLWASLVYFVSTMLLAYPALAGQFLINARSDQYIAGYAFRDFAAQSLRSGHGFPQWNPFLQGGLPYIAAMHGDIFYPTFLLRMIMPTDKAMTWEFVIHLFLCGLFTYRFLRAWGFGFYGALIGGLAYMLGGSIAGLASPGHDGKLFVSTLTPLMLLVITRGVRDGRMWAWGALAAVVGLTFLTPHPQLFEYCMLLAGCFALFVAFADHPGYGKLSRDVALRRIGLALGAVILGILIGAIQYWPSLIEYKPWSPRAGGHSWEEATSYSYPIEEVLNWYWPHFTGILDDYWGRNRIHLHSDYFGAVVLMLAGAAFGQTGQKKLRLFWSVTGVVSLIWAFGGNTPFYHIPMAIVPMTKYLRAPSTIIYITAMSVAVLAGIGTERLLAHRVSAKYATIWIVAAGVFALLMSVGGYSALAGASGVGDYIAQFYPPDAHGQVVDAINQRIQANAPSAILDVWRSFIFIALAAGAIWAYMTDRLRVRKTVIALAVLVAVDLWSVERNYWIFSPPASKLFATDPAIESIKADVAKSGQPGRVSNPPLGQGIATELGRQDRTFTGDHLMIHGLRIDTGYHGNELGMYEELLAQDSGNVRFSPEFWRHENVQYWYTGADEQTMAQLASQLHTAPFIKLAGPVRNVVGSMVYAYKIPMTNPYAWTATAIVKAPQLQALATVLNPRFDPTTVAIADTSARDIQGTQISTLPPPSSTHATITAYRPGSVDLTLAPPPAAGQALVVSENYFPGWHATVDGKPAPVGLTNFNLIGVALPQGARQVSLRFIDAAYEKGKVVTLIAALVAIAAWIAGAIVDRRRGLVAA